MTVLDILSFLAPALIGVVATAILDLWALLLNRTLSLPMTNWGHVGRWLVGIGGGIYRTEAISESPAVTFERTIGWATHYSVGAVYALIYLAIVEVTAQAPSAYSAALFGLATVLAPWLILQPGLGLGIFARRSPKPHLTRTLNVLAHLVFGIGLYLGWRVVLLLLGNES